MEYAEHSIHNTCGGAPRNAADSEENSETHSFFVSFANSTFNFVGAVGIIFLAELPLTKIATPFCFLGLFLFRQSVSPLPRRFTANSQMVQVFAGNPARQSQSYRDLWSAEKICAFSAKTSRQVETEGIHSSDGGNRIFKHKFILERIGPPGVSLRGLSSQLRGGFSVVSF